MTSPSELDRVSFLDSLPFFGVHAIALATPFLVPFEWRWVALAAGLYSLRMFAITAGYHRYFSHRAFRTSRAFQAVLAFLGATATQKGPLWWAAHHRDHHRNSDRLADLHSPLVRGFWWSHVGWILARRYEATRLDRVRDLARFPELLWIDRLHLVPPVLLATALFLVGGAPALLWGFFVSTVALWHGTFAINSLAHVFGRRRYETGDGSRNGMLLALLTFGEGWHNNHHFYPASANQGFFWWEIDVSYYVLRLLESMGVVWDLRAPPPQVKFAHLATAGNRGLATPPAGAALPQPSPDAGGRG